MDQNKVTALFRREWARVTKGMLSLPQPVAIEPQWGEVGYDLMITLDGGVDGLVKSLLELTGCIVVLVIDRTAHVRVPDNWVTAPTRLMFAATGQERLHNALLDAGIADWLDIRLTTDKAALEVEFIEHPTSEQIAALKHDYDVLTFEELTYTFVERTAAPLVSPLTVETRLREAWGGSRAGKILAVEATDNPRQWLVTARKTIPNNARFADHGLKQIELWASENKALIEIGDALWSKLLQKPSPAPETTATTEAAIVADTDTQPIPEPEFSGDLLMHLGEVYLRMGKDINIERTHPLVSEYDALTAAGVASKVELDGWLFYQLTAEGEALVKAMLAAGATLSDSAAPSPELDERNLEINQLKTQVENLYEIIRSLTPVTDEWQTVKITLPKDGKVIAHPEIAAEQAKGWDVHHVNYISNGEDRLYVLMVKRGKAKHEMTRHYAAGGYVTSSSPFMRRDTVVPVNGKGEWSIADAMIDAMNDELTPSMNALAAAFGVDLGAWR